jgi:uncharacterized protein (DUF169 family)
MVVSQNSHWGTEIERILLLKTSPIAVKMLQKEKDIPKGAFRPLKDEGIHIAQCQAFALSRRQRMTVAMLKEDNWCPAPISAYGMVTPREDYPGFPHVIEDRKAAERLAQTSPEFDHGKYIGIVSAPLKRADFEPDVIIIFSNVTQLRNILYAVKYKEGCLVNTVLDPLRSCVFSIVPVIQTGECRVTIPDPGEYLRTMCGDDEIIFSAPGDKVAGLVYGLQHFSDLKQGYADLCFDMRPDFHQPEHYRKMFEEWGLSSGKQSGMI